MTTPTSGLVTTSLGLVTTSSGGPDDHVNDLGLGDHVNHVDLRLADHEDLGPDDQVMTKTRPGVIHPFDP